MKQTKKDIDYKLRCDKLESQLNSTKKALKKKALKLIDAEVRYLQVVEELTMLKMEGLCKNR